jgi:hypothetical protein
MAPVKDNTEGFPGSSDQLSLLVIIAAVVVIPVAVVE